MTSHKTFATDYTNLHRFNLLIKLRKICDKNLRESLKFVAKENRNNKLITTTKK